MEKIINLAKRRGFIQQSSLPYGGFSSSYDYGPLGVELKNNIKREWWKSVVYKNASIFGLDSAILMNPKIWEASGHLSAGFADPLVECKKCHHRFRRDHLKDDFCTDCKGELTEEKKFNLMLKTFIGPVEDETTQTYLRPETAQGIYMNFEWVLESMRTKIPFGIAQIGKAFRNEITPSNFIFRTREFEQMEMQYFINEKNWKETYETWKEKRMQWYISLGMKKKNLRIKDHKKDELAHYALAAGDIEYKFPDPMGWQELEGIHYRGDWDLANHSKYSGKEISYFDIITSEKYIPHIIETSAGADRATLAFMVDSFEEVIGARTETTEAKKEKEIILKLHKLLSPVKVAIFPLVKNKPELVELAKKLYDELSEKIDGIVWYDEVGSIGKRYRRQDEVGTYYCVTIDFDSATNGDVTVRDRDTMSQERVKISELATYLHEKLK